MHSFVCFRKSLLRTSHMLHFADDGCNHELQRHWPFPHTVSRGSSIEEGIDFSLSMLTPRFISA